VKIAPHLGHLIFASLPTPAHPKENSDKVINTNKALTHFFIRVHLLWSKKKEKEENHLPLKILFFRAGWRRTEEEKR
jgi:hypothetical protein